jgi:hypothetical protein
MPFGPEIRYISMTLFVLGCLWVATRPNNFLQTLDLDAMSSTTTQASLSLSSSSSSSSLAKQPFLSWTPKSTGHNCQHGPIPRGSFKGQDGEDKVLLTSWFDNLCGGMYLEIGGFTGITFSNSYVFHYGGLNWTGVMVEANPKVRTTRE